MNKPLYICICLRLFIIYAIIKYNTTCIDRLIASTAYVINGNTLHSAKLKLIIAYYSY